MKEIQLTIKALSPLAVGRQKPGGSISEAQDYIPGSVIRGAIAGQILREPNVDPDQPGGDFQSLFVDEGAAIFTNAYPTSRNKDTAQILPVHVLPATAVSSKNDSGFKSEKDKNHGVFDTLIDRFCAEGFGHLYDPNCPEDCKRVEPFGGFYSKQGKHYCTHSAETRLLTRVGINRRRNTAQEKVLYSIEAINEKKRDKDNKKTWNPSFFRSSIYLEDADLAQLLADYLTSNPLRLGGSASRGLGKVEFQAEVKDYQADTATRIKQFNDALKKRWEKWESLFSNSKTPLPEGHTFFTLNLQADAILTEQWRRTTVVSETMLRQITGIEDPELTLHASYSSYDYLSGWNSAWGLMKDVELVTNKGAVYLFSTPNIKIWLPALEKLEQQGIGDRTCEGFGQLQICNEFHQIFREDAV
jgi:CRISPR-associated protein Csx10